MNTWNEKLTEATLFTPKRTIIHKQIISTQTGVLNNSHHEPIPTWPAEKRNNTNSVVNAESATKVKSDKIAYYIIVFQIWSKNVFLFRK